MKFCRKCQTRKTEDCFGTLKINGRVYLRSYCKDCTRVYNREMARKRGIRTKKRTIESIPNQKQCSHCGEVKPSEDFRIRLDKRSTPHFTYLNSTCIKCDAEIKRNRVRAERLTPEGRAKHNNWAKEFHKRHREAMLKYGKERRDNPEYKQYRAEYNRQNKERIKQLGKRRNQKYLKKIIDQDSVPTSEFYLKYARKQLKQQFGIKEIPEELVIAKSIILQLKRKIKNHD